MFMMYNVLPDYLPLYY